MLINLKMYLLCLLLFVSSVAGSRFEIAPLRGYDREVMRHELQKKGLDLTALRTEGE